MKNLVVVAGGDSDRGLLLKNKLDADRCVPSGPTIDVASVEQSFEGGRRPRTCQKYRTNALA